MRLQINRLMAILGVGCLAATLACQTAQKQAFLPPALAQAPAIAAATNPPEPAEPKATPAAAAEPQAKPQPAQAAPAPDPVADLVARAERDYQAGEENYRAGHFESAKQSFDAALNLLLDSSLGANYDKRLEDELNRILEALNRPELAALQQGDSAEQKSEPAPIDEANEVTPQVDPKLKAKAEAEIQTIHSDLPLMLTDPVAGYINYFSNRGRGTMERAFARSGRYEEMIRHTLQEEGVPTDLIYLAQAESGFHPLAVSRAGARGMWQFMSSRARGYGLERSVWVDDRQDPEKATRAAARHLKDLYGQFGDWYLAMAAYNSGPGTVQSAVKRTGYADFWELYRRNVLPRETRNYVPIIVAVTIMAKNPGQYGLDAVEKEKPVPYDAVVIDYPIDLRLAAQCIGATVADIQDLNPSLLRLTTPKGRDFELRLPVGTKDKYLTAVAAIPTDKRLWWRYHTVKQGETLTSIAKTYHTTAKAISDANELDGAAPDPEARLVIPIAPGKYDDGGTYARRITRYKIQKGDTVESVAENFGIPAKMIRGWNHIKGNSLAGRRVLYLHLPVTPGAEHTQVASHHPGKSRTHPATTQAAAATNQAAGKGAIVHHTVKSGETLYSIANSYNTTVAALQRDNQNVDVLRPGMVLIVHDAR